MGSKTCNLLCHFHLDICLSHTDGIVICNAHSVFLTQVVPKPGCKLHRTPKINTEKIST